MFLILINVDMPLLGIFENVSVNSNRLLSKLRFGLYFYIARSSFLFLSECTI